jgi:dipeptide/tripeptide permease
MGGFFGAVFSGVISESFGFRVALAIAVGVSAVVAGLFYLLGSRHHKADAARVADEIAADAAAFGGIKEKA